MRDLLNTLCLKCDEGLFIQSSHFYNRPTVYCPYCQNITDRYPEDCSINNFIHPEFLIGDNKPYNYIACSGVRSTDPITIDRNYFEELKEKAAKYEELSK